MTTTTTHVGAELREARKRAGLSREKLARLASCSTAWLAQLECGLRPGTSDALLRIWHVLDAMNGSGADGQEEQG